MQPRGPGCSFFRRHANFYDRPTAGNIIGYDMTKALAGRAFLLLAALVSGSHAATAASQTVFPTADAAANALLTALASGDYSLLGSVAGPQTARVWSGPGQAKEVWDRERFVETARRKGLQAGPLTSSRSMVYAGDLKEPFPAPLIRTETGWQFDDEAGSRELLGRRMRRNEIAVIEICQRFREAQYEFFAIPREGVSSFAMKIRSTPGQHDGLYWSDPGAEDESPMGPPFAAAAYTERQPGDGTRPLFGYYYKILPAQGRDAAGGALDYRTKGQLRKGFALIAWPAEYGVDGTVSFLINHFGDLFRKDLGAETSRIVDQMTAFNPDRSWSKINVPD